MTTSTLITTARTLLSELQDRRTLAIAAGQRPLSDALLTLSVEYETLLGKLLKVYPEEQQPEPEPEYRMLEVGEEVREGDEWRYGKNWESVTVGAFNLHVNHRDVGYLRRRIIPPADMDTLCRFHVQQCGKDKV